MPPRISSTDYPAHQTISNLAIAAVRMKPDQAAKMFSADIEKNYVVLEVALYPQNGATLDVDRFAFGLRFGSERETHPDTPEAVAVPWGEKSRINERVAVTEQAGVFVATQKDGTGRRTTTTGAYDATGVAVGGPQSQPYPDPPRGPIPRVVVDRLQAGALPEEKTSRAIAGYLYFPQPPKKPKDSKLELTYSKDGSSISSIVLLVPAN